MLVEQGSFTAIHSPNFSFSRHCPKPRRIFTAVHNSKWVLFTWELCDSPDKGGFMSNEAGSLGDPSGAGTKVGGSVYLIDKNIRANSKDCLDDLMDSSLERGIQGRSLF